MAGTARVLGLAPLASFASPHSLRPRPARAVLASAAANEPAVAPRDASGASPPLPSTFKRLIARSTGASFSDVAEIEEAPMPQELGEGEVLIRVVYAGVNGGCETFRARGEHAFAANRGRDVFPLGAEGSGVIVRAGPGVSPTLQPGQAVTFIGGAFAEYVVAKAALCWPVSAATAESVALTISGTVANAALKYVGGMTSGQTVLVTAAGGATGSFAVQLALAAGCRVVATAGSDEKIERLQRLGVHRIIDHRREGVGKVLQKEFSGAIDLAYEGVGGALAAAAWDALRRPGGRLLAVGYMSEYPHVREVERAAATAAQQRGALPPSAELFWGGLEHAAPDGRVALGKVWPSDRADTLKAKAEVFAAHERGELAAWVDGARAFQGVEAAPSAVEWMLTGRAVGKVVVKVGSSA